MTIAPRPVHVRISVGWRRRRLVLFLLPMGVAVAVLVFNALGQPFTGADVIVGIIGMVLLLWPVHEGLHWFAFLLVGVRVRQIKCGHCFLSVHAPGVPLSRRRYVMVLVSPLIVLIGTAVALLGREEGRLVVVLVVAGALPVFLNDLERVAGVLRAPAGLVWDDVEGAALGSRPSI